MNNYSGLALTPGQYQFRPNSLVPWINVRVFRESITNKENLRVRWAGVEIDVSKLASYGQWKAL